MSPLTGVIDATAIIGLSKGQVFGRLASLYRRLYVTPLVRAEIIDQGQGRAGASELLSALGVWVTEVVPDAAFPASFAALRSPADREVLAIAHDPGLAVDHLLSDDVRLVARVTNPNLSVLRTPDVVVLLKRHGQITEVRSVFDRMRLAGFGIDPSLQEQALRAAGEWSAP